jgi:hypothetical protein
MSYYNVQLRVIKCLSTESGVDAETIGAISNLAKSYFETTSKIADESKNPELKAAGSIAQLEAKIAESIPGLAAAIDHDRNDPDQLYITGGNDPGTAIWPSPGKASDNNYEIRTNGIWAGNSSLLLAMNASEDEDKAFSLWEYDSGSRDDFMGSFLVRHEEIGKGRIAKIVDGTVENSIYLVEYEVVPKKDKVSEYFKQIMDDHGVSLPS